jgi:succinylarginine dihydrolase
VPCFVPVEVDSITLDDAIRSYLFNSQLITLPDGSMALVLPSEAQDHEGVWAAVEGIVAGNNPIAQAIVNGARDELGALPAVTEFTNLPGSGATAVVEGRRYEIGRPTVSVDGGAGGKRL